MKGLKKVAAHLVAIALLAGSLTGCQTSMANGSAQIDEPGVGYFSALFENAESLAAMFEGMNVPGTTANITTLNGQQYRQVNDWRFSTRAALKEILLRSFSEDLTDQFMATQPQSGAHVFEDIDQKLYWFDGFVAQNDYTGGQRSYQIIKDDNGQITALQVNLSDKVYDDIIYQTATRVDLTKVEENDQTYWHFSSFELPKQKTIELAALEIASKYWAARELFFYFNVTSMDIDNTQVINKDGRVWHMVSDDAYQTMTDLKTALNDLFEPALAEALLARNRFTEYNGRLYTQLADSGTSITRGNERIISVARQDDKIILTAGVEITNGIDEVIGEELRDFALVERDGVWRFEAFELLK